MVLISFLLVYSSVSCFVNHNICMSDNTCLLAQAILVMLSIAWIASLGNWLTWAYQLEFKGAGVHFFVWLAGLLWVTANAVLIREMVITFLDCDGRPKGKGNIKEA